MVKKNIMLMVSLVVVIAMAMAMGVIYFIASQKSNQGLPSDVPSNAQPSTQNTSLYPFNANDNLDQALQDLEAINNQ